MRLIVGIPQREIRIEEIADLPRVRRLVEELDDELVIAQRIVENRADVPVPNSSTCGPGRLGNGSFQFIDDQMFAEGREGLLRPACEREQRRIEKLEPDRVPNNMPPHAGAR